MEDGDWIEFANQLNHREIDERANTESILCSERAARSPENFQEVLLLSWRRRLELCQMLAMIFFFNEEIIY